MEAVADQLDPKFQATLLLLLIKDTQPDPPMLDELLAFAEQHGDMLLEAMAGFDEHKR